MTLDHQLDAAFQARHLAVPMGMAFPVQASTSVMAARDALSMKGFDQAPVMLNESPIRFVLVKDLVGGPDRRVRDVMTRLGSGNVVSGDASVGALLEWIIEPGFLFVIEGREVTGFITVFDFNKQPARAHLFLLLARLESGLADLLRLRYADDQRRALEFVTDDSRPEILAKYEADMAASKESEILAYFDFSDLVNVVRGDAALRAWIGDWTARRWKSETGGLVDLRNQVMHPVRNVVLAKAGLIQLRDRERRTRDLIAAVESAAERVTA